MVGLIQAGKEHLRLNDLELVKLSNIPTQTHVR